MPFTSQVTRYQIFFLTALPRSSLNAVLRAIVNKKMQYQCQFVITIWEIKNQTWRVYKAIWIHHLLSCKRLSIFNTNNEVVDYINTWAVNYAQFDMNNWSNYIKFLWEKKKNVRINNKMPSCSYLNFCNPRI